MRGFERVMKEERISIGALLDEMAERQPDHDALVYLDLPVRYSYSEFRKICNQVAKGLMKLGIQKGDHLSIWANNVPEWVIAQFATAKAGAVLVTINTSYQTLELEYVLKQSDSRHLMLIEGVKGREYLEMIHELCPELRDCPQGQLKCRRLPLLRNVIYLGEEKNPGMTSWAEVVEAGKEVTDRELGRRQALLDPDEVINMQYTSGTTGFPKGVMLSHTNLIGNARSIAECLNFSQRDRLCIPVPFFHCFGCVLGTLTCVVSGATMVPVVPFKPDKVLQTIEKEHCTAVHGVPTMFIAELEELSKKDYDTSSLRTGIMAGSPCPIEVMKSVCHDMGAREICITYGLTEASPAITMTRTDDPIELRVSTVGRALPNVEVQIVDPESGEVLGAGQQGELCTRGYHLMKGYFKMPEATDSVIDQEGWLYTGDLAVMDENGYCRITGRLKDMIIRGGENIYPREIEEFLYRHPKVKDVQVVGVPSRRYGEEVVAFVQLREGQTAGPEDIRDFCKGKISRQKIPEFVIFVTSYPATSSGKVQKYKLREIATKQLDREKESRTETV
jgi:fatty-acyl-CoA synthase